MFFNVCYVLKKNLVDKIDEAEWDQHAGDQIDGTRPFFQHITNIKKNEKNIKKRVF